MILYVSDFDMQSSGYMGISIGLCNELTRRGHDVLALGIGYKGEEHHWDFNIIPIKTDNIYNYVAAIIHNIRKLSEENTRLPRVEAIIVALDVPHHEVLCSLERGDIPYIGIFPIESGPLCMSWAASLNNMTDRLVISKFGLAELEKAGLACAYLPVGMDAASWRLPTDKERKMLREGMGYDENTCVILTVADNHERKNLGATAQIVKNARAQGVNAKWILVTRKNLSVGWRLDDLFFELGITEHVTLFERGLAFERMWVLHAIADIFLLTSKAEGLCLPIMEAQAVGALVAATDCTAIIEHLEDGRGARLPVEFMNIDPWGNSWRSYVDVVAGATVIQNLWQLTLDQKATMRRKAREYVESRTWDKAADVVEARLAANPRPLPEVIPEATPEPPSQPSTVPHMIPSMEGTDEQQEEPQPQQGWFPSDSTPPTGTASTT